MSVVWSVSVSRWPGRAPSAEHGLWHCASVPPPSKGTHSISVTSYRFMIFHINKFHDLRFSQQISHILTYQTRQWPIKLEARGCLRYLRWMLCNRSLLGQSPDVSWVRAQGPCGPMQLNSRWNRMMFPQISTWWNKTNGNASKCVETLAHMQRSTASKILHTYSWVFFASRRTLNWRFQ